MIENGNEEEGRQFGDWKDGEMGIGKTEGRKGRKDQSNLK